MSKFGDGLNIEFIRAVKAGVIAEPFCVHDVMLFAKNKGWNPSVQYINVVLSNGASQTHSPNNKKYFVRVGRGKYALSDLAIKEV